MRHLKGVRIPDDHCREREDTSRGREDLRKLSPNGDRPGWTGGRPAHEARGICRSAGVPRTCEVRDALLARAQDSNGQIGGWLPLALERENSCRTIQEW